MTIVERTDAVGLPPLDALYGVSEIAAALRLNPRQAHYQLKLGRLPARKIGGRWTTTLSLLRQHFEAVLPVSLPQPAPAPSRSKRAQQFAHAKLMRDAKMQRALAAAKEQRRAHRSRSKK